jgi:hypothetical protein
MLTIVEMPIVRIDWGLREFVIIPILIGSIVKSSFDNNLHSIDLQSAMGAGDSPAPGRRL